MTSKAIHPDTVSATNAIDRITQKMMATLGNLRHAIETPDRSPFRDTDHRVGLVIRAANELELLSDFAKAKIRQQGETMTTKPFKIDCREFGRGPANIESFKTLVEARDHIRDHWQGPDYIDGPGGFHSDYCTFELIGFALADVGKRGTGEDGYFDWHWHTLPGDPAPAIADDRRPETTAWDDDEPAEYGPFCRPPEPRRPAPDDIPF